MIDLFNMEEIPNLLPYEGNVRYYGKVLKIDKAQHYFQQLINTVAWRNDEAIIFGKKIITKRKVAWYGDRQFDYTYSNTTKTAMVWTQELLELKELVESVTAQRFNSCLLNLYHNGQEGMGWHSDDEKSLGLHSAIASLSLGATRKFAFKHKKTKQTVSTVLESGSLLVMQDETQSHWLHRLPPTTLVKHARINLTFRSMIVS